MKMMMMSLLVTTAMVESIAKELGVKRYVWLVYMDYEAKEEERRQKEVIKGDPAIETKLEEKKKGFALGKRGKEKHLELLVMEYFTVILIHEHLGCCPEESLLMKPIHVLDSLVHLYTQGAMLVECILVMFM